MVEYQYVSGNKRKSNGKKQSITKHRKVWMEHHGEIPKGYLIHHINGNKKDNRIENLQCVTYREHALIHNSSHNQQDSSHNQCAKLDCSENLINDLTI